jgi:hypothetical protein
MPAARVIRAWSKMHRSQRVAVSLHYWYGFSGALVLGPLGAARHWQMLTDYCGGSGSSLSAPPSTALSRSCVSLLLFSVARVSGTTRHQLPKPPPLRSWLLLTEGTLHFQPCH